jgi:mono/diheme cytochrome c family protein
MAALVGASPLTPSRPAAAAVSSGSEGFENIAFPKTQRKVGADETKDFADGRLTVTVAEIGATTVQLAPNGRAQIKLTTGELSFFAPDEETICTLTYLGKSGAKAIVAADCAPADAELQAALDAQTAAAAGEVRATIAPLDLVAGAAKGELHNPFDGDASVVAEGRTLFLANSCNGCHGGTGGGGMGPPLTNPVWVYGKDDDTLFRLVTLGSEELQANGYARVAREKVVGPMPPFGDIIEDSDQLWKILAFIRSINKG